MARLVQCAKLGEELPGMPFKPFPTELGQRIYDSISMKAWQMWISESPRYINTYRIDLQSAEGREFMEKQMKIFFGFDEMRWLDRNVFDANIDAARVGDEVLPLQFLRNSCRWNAQLRHARSIQLDVDDLRLAFDARPADRPRGGAGARCQ